jgi:hypothetical protein
MDTPTLSQWDCETMVSGDEIRLTLRPSTRLEDVSGEELLALTPAELLAYAADLRTDLGAVRDTLSAALALVAQQHDQLARAARVVDAQRRQLRDLRERAA